MVRCSSWGGAVIERKWRGVVVVKDKSARMEREAIALPVLCACQVPCGRGRGRWGEGEGGGTSNCEPPFFLRN